MKNIIKYSIFVVIASQTLLGNNLLFKQGARCSARLFMNDQHNKNLRNILSYYLQRKTLVSADIATGGLNDQLLLNDMLEAAKKSRIRLIAPTESLKHIDGQDIWKRHNIAAVFSTFQDHQRLSSTVFRFKDEKKDSHVGVIYTPHLTNSGLECDRGVVIITKSAASCVSLRQAFEEVWNKLATAQEETLQSELNKEIELFNQWCQLFGRIK
ncbi:MAG TPA: hypothetical protein VLG50_00190 [Candidatus Saccharimonadales bacterium]|nr:hypothetical protein [Candidatus Saccharimonadales bacterium]